MSDAVLAAALGLDRKPEEEEVSEAEYSEADLKRMARRKLVFERRARGDTDEEILHFLAQNGYPISRRTLHYDLKSNEIITFTDELLREQLRDIAILRGFALQDSANPDLKALYAAIAARGQVLRNLQPSERANVTVNNLTQVNAKAETKVMIDLSQMSKDDREAILRAEEALTRAERATGPK